MASPTLRSSTAPVAGLSTTSPAGTQAGDLVVIHTWERAGAGIPTHTVDTAGGYVTILSHSHNDGSTDGRLSVAYKIATSGGAVAYQAYTSSVGTETWTGCQVIEVGTYGLTIASAGVTATGTGAPNPPAVTVNAAWEYLTLAISAWHLSASQTLTPAHATYALQTHVAGAATGDVAVATLAVAAGVTSIDPGAYTDNQTPNGTCSITIAIPEPPVFGDLMQKLFTDDPADNAGIPFTGPVRAGDLLIVAECMQPADVASTVTDSQTNTWTQADRIFAGSEFIAVHWAIAGADGTCTISVNTGTGITERSRIIAQYAGPFDSAPEDTSIAATSTGTTASSGNISPSVDGCLIVGFHSAPTDLTSSGSVNIVDHDGASVPASILLQHVVQTSAANIAATATLSSGLWKSIAVAFKPPGAAAHELVVDGGVYSITGAAASLEADRLFSAEGGSYSITGAVVGLELGRPILAEAGTYSITGANVALDVTRQIIAEAGTYSITGADAALLVERMIAAESGAYIIAGADAALEYVPSGGQIIEAEGGAYTITGAVVGLTAARTIAVDGGAYIIAGATVAFSQNRVLAAGSGAYLITGNATTMLTWSGETPPETGRQAFMPTFRTRRGR